METKTQSRRDFLRNTLKLGAGIAAMSEGRPASEIIKTVRGLVCRNKQSGSSCADQLALGLQQALLIIHGTPCPGCDSGVCVNAK